MAKPRKKRRQPRQIETALPKRQYKRTNRMLYAVSAVLLVVFGGGAAILGAGAPKAPPATPVPTVVPAPTSSGAGGQAQSFTTTPTPAPSPTATPGQSPTGTPGQ